MKRILATILSLIFIVSFAGCGDTAGNDADNSKNTTETENSLNSGTEVLQPEKTEIIPKVQTIARAYPGTDSCLLYIKNDNSLWGWAPECTWLLGDGTIPYDIPTGLEDKYEEWAPRHIMDDVVSVDAAGSVCAALTSDNVLHIWGKNQYLLGSAERNESDTANIMHIEDVATYDIGYNIAAIIKNDGSLWIWGYGTGMLITSDKNSGWTDVDYKITEPAKVMDGVISAACSGFSGQSNVFVIKEDGSVWGWGTNRDGELATGEKTDDPINEPVKILDSAVTIEVGEDVCFAIDEDGTLWGWGNNYNGALLGTLTVNATTPRVVMEDVTAVSAAEDGASSLILKKDGTLFGMGKGIKDENATFIPVEITQGVNCMLDGCQGYLLYVTNDGTLCNREADWLHNLDTYNDELNQLIKDSFLGIKTLN